MYDRALIFAENIRPRAKNVRILETRLKSPTSDGTQENFRNVSALDVVFPVNEMIGLSSRKFAMSPRRPSNAIGSGVNYVYSSELDADFDPELFPSGETSNSTRSARPFLIWDKIDPLNFSAVAQTALSHRSGTPTTTPHRGPMPDRTPFLSG